MMRIEQQLRDSSTSILAPQLADFSVTTVEKLRFADTDRQGHITNTVFVVCCQNARMELLCDPKRVPIPRDTQFVVPGAHWRGTVGVGTRVERVGRSSVRLVQALFVDEGCAATAESIVALMNTTTRRSMLLPHETAEALRAMAQPNCSWVPAAAATVGVPG